MNCQAASSVRQSSSPEFGFLTKCGRQSIGRLGLNLVTRVRLPCQNGQLSPDRIIDRHMEFLTKSQWHPSRGRSYDLSGYSARGYPIIWFPAQERKAISCHDRCNMATGCSAGLSACLWPARKPIQWPSAALRRRDCPCHMIWLPESGSCFRSRYPPRWLTGRTASPSRSGAARSFSRGRRRAGSRAHGRRASVATRGRGRVGRAAS